MFDHYTHTQAFADAVKRIVYDSGAPRPQQRPALNAISSFERCDWRPEVMQECADYLNITGLRLDDENRLIYDEPDQAPTQAALVIEVLLTRYVEALEGIQAPVYSTKEAAVYLGVSVPTIKKYVHQTESLPSIKRGHALIFTREMLDAFEKPKYGRPWHREIT